MAARSPQRRIAVLPNSRTAGLAAVLLGMWYAGASQNNGAAYLLCFVLTALALVSIVHTWTNLRGLALTAGPIAPVFSGEDLAVPIFITAGTSRSHFALDLRVLPQGFLEKMNALEPPATSQLELHCRISERGRFREIDVQIASTFPLGFFTARQRWTLAAAFHIYPAPRGEAPLPQSLAPTREPRAGARVVGEDYGGVRAWQPGESQRHIDWKAAARGQPLLTKQWTGEADEILRFDWATLGALHLEARLSQLAKWVVLAERGGAIYELRLPAQTLRAARGEAHYHACLRALAEFENPAETLLP